jgi:hypothetical protein
VCRGCRESTLGAHTGGTPETAAHPHRLRSSVFRCPCRIGQRSGETAGRPVAAARAARVYFAGAGSNSRRPAERFPRNPLGRPGRYPPTLPLPSRALSQVRKRRQRSRIGVVSGSLRAAYPGCAPDHTEVPP